MLYIATSEVKTDTRGLRANFVDSEKSRPDFFPFFYGRRRSFLRYSSNVMAFTPPVTNPS